MPRIIISYRRSDSEAVTGRIFDRLVAHYGRDAIFRDVDNIPLGVDFRQHIDGVLRQSDLVLVVIGPRWLGGRGEQSRISNPTDPVRIEVAAALRKGTPVVPILVGRTEMPAVERLPEDMRDLAYRNGLQIDPGRDFDVHVERLLRELDRIDGMSRPGGQAATNTLEKTQAAPIEVAAITPLSEHEAVAAKPVDIAPSPEFAAGASLAADRPRAAAPETAEPAAREHVQSGAARAPVQVSALKRICAGAVIGVLAAAVAQLIENLMYDVIYKSSPADMDWGAYAFCCVLDSIWAAVYAARQAVPHSSVGRHLGMFAALAAAAIITDAVGDLLIGDTVSDIVEAGTLIPLLIVNSAWAVATIWLFGRWRTRQLAGHFGHSQVVS